MGNNFEKPLSVIPGAGMQNGKFFEKSIFGVCCGKEGDGYKTYNEAIKWVKSHQSEKNLRLAETLDCEQLQLLKVKILEKLPNINEVLRFYTAIGSKLDILHGADGFFELGDKIVTIDLTLNPQKGYAKADVIILADDEHGITDSIAEEAANDITRMFAVKSMKNIQK